MHPLNPEAGQYDHMPSDPRAVAVVMRFGPAALRAFPYLWWRYGERGQRFLLSDCAYLVAMAEYGQRTLHRQVGWTADVLAPRGMPRWLTEVHLVLLGRMLARALPDQPALAACLAHEAEQLRLVRLAALSAEAFTSCAEHFIATLAPSSGPRRLWHGFGCLLASAVADERAGLRGVIASLSSWASDPTRFDRRWIDAVESTLQLAETRE